MSRKLMLILATLILASCQKMDQAFNQNIKFKPLKKFTVDFFIDHDRGQNSVLKIIDAKDNSVAFRLITGSNFSTYKIQDNIVFVSVLDQSKDAVNLILQKINTKSGEVIDTGIRLFDVFKFDPSGKWLCYTYNGHPVDLSAYPGEKYYFPVIGLKNMETGEYYDYDKTDDLSSKPTHATIELVDNGFRVEYFCDSSIPLRIGVINLTTKEFTWEK